MTNVCPIHGIDSAYSNRDCRCDWCMVRNAERKRMIRRDAGGQTTSDRVQSRARTRALRWVREEHPETWRLFLDEARSTIRD